MIPSQIFQGPSSGLLLLIILTSVFILNGNVEEEEGLQIDRRQEMTTERKGGYRKLRKIPIKSIKGWWW